MKAFVSILAIASLLATAAVAFAAPVAKPDPTPGVVRVKFTAEAVAGLDPLSLSKNGAALSGAPAVDALAMREGVTKISSRTHAVANQVLDAKLGLSRWYTLEVAAGTDIEALVERLKNDPAVENATGVYTYTPDAVPNDRWYADNWGHNNTGQFLDGVGTCFPQADHRCGTAVGTVGFDTDAETAWDGPQGYGDPNVIIGIIDDGILDHDDLNQVAGYDFIDDDSDATPAGGDTHGTSVAGSAGMIADNNLGGTGIAGGCSLMPLRASASSEVADAILWAVDNGAKVLNMSFSFVGSTYLADVWDALDYAYASNVMCFSSTGNDNYGVIYAPGSHPHVVSVGAASPCGSRKRGTSDPNGMTCDNEDWNSNYASNVQDSPNSVDILAPTMIMAPAPDGNGNMVDGSSYYWYTQNGTSMASPYAAGVAALVFSRYPNLTVDQVRARMMDTATDIVDVEAGAGWDRYTGYGLVNAAGAIEPIWSLHVPSNISTIQAAIDAATSLDVIRVSAGTYNEAIDFKGKHIKLIALDGPAVTTIDATGLGLPAVTFSGGETRGTIIEGFTISGASVVGNGGGVYSNGGSFTMINCVVEDNAADNGGGMFLDKTAAYIQDSTVGTVNGNSATAQGGGIYFRDPADNGLQNELHNVLFKFNTAVDKGGAIEANRALLLIEDSNIQSNVADAAGGGLHNRGSGAGSTTTIRNTWFLGNSAGTTHGGAIQQSGGSSVLYVFQTHFRSNTAAGNGGAVQIDGATYALFVNSEFWDNQADRGSACYGVTGSTIDHWQTTVAKNHSPGTSTDDGSALQTAGTLNVVGTIAWGNTSSNGSSTEWAQIGYLSGGSGFLRRSCIEGLATLTGQFLISGDPLFANLATGNLAILNGSSCIDTSEESIVTDGGYLFDLVGNDRLRGCGVDIGAYESIPQGPIFDVPGEMLHIQCAIEYAGVGNTIRVAPGVYNEALDFMNKDITLVSTDGPLATTIDGSGLTGPTLTLSGGQSESSVIDGFTFSGNTADSAVRIENGAATFQNCGFDSNSNSTAAGAIDVVNGRVTVEDSEFVGNSGADGGAIQFDGHFGNPSDISYLRRSAFANNDASGLGGGVATSGNYLSVEDCTFAANTAVAGGGLHIEGGALLDIQRCDFEGNSANNNGGGIRVRGASIATVKSSRFYGNVANDDLSATNHGGGAIQFQEGSSVVVLHCSLAGNSTLGISGTPGGGIAEFGSDSTLDLRDSIVWGNTATNASTTEDAQIYATNLTAQFTHIEGLSGYAGNDNSGNDPYFVDFELGNLHLIPFSSAVNSAGGSAQQFGIALDLDRNPRVNGGTGDRGAYELTSPTDVDTPDARIPAVFALHPAAPNPFNPRTTIKFAVPVAGKVEIELFDLRGQRVRTLQSGLLPAGTHEVVWDGVDNRGQGVASGMYFARMVSGSFQATQRLTLLK